MEGKGAGRQCRIRKRGCSSSSSSSLVRQYRFKRAILVGKKAGSSTPVPTWETSRRSSPPSLAMPITELLKSLPPTARGKGKELSISARKLAATLWEINDVPSPKGKRELDITKEMVSKVSKRGQLPQLFPDSSHSHVSEIEINSRGGANHGYAAGVKPRLKDISNSLRTSKELLKVLYRVSGFDQHHQSGKSLISALRAELDGARSQVKQLIREQQSNCNDIEELKKRFAEERTAWKSRERERICELEAERKLRRQTERLNKKLGIELAEAKTSLEKVLKELETEKRAKDILEQVCDELAKGIGDDRAEVEELKRESAKVLEEVEKEREMFQLADVLREERVQMKLAEAKYHFEEKNAAIEQLRSELETYLKHKMCKENGEDSQNSERIVELESLLRKTDFKLCLEIANVSPKSERSRELETFLRQNHIGLCHGAEGKAAGEAADKEHIEDADSADSDLHSIELNMDSNSKSYKWSYARGDANGHDSDRLPVDKLIGGRKSNGKKFQRGSLIFGRESNFDIGWDIDLKDEDVEDGFQREGSSDLVSPSRSPKTEDELEQYKSVKCLREDILSGSRCASLESSATPNRQWDQSFPLQNSSIMKKLNVAEGE